MGFDVGAFLGDLILAFFAQDGHADQVNDRKVCTDLIIASLSLFFCCSFSNFICSPLRYLMV